MPQEVGSVQKLPSPSLLGHPQILTQTKVRLPSTLIILWVRTFIYNPPETGHPIYILPVTNATRTLTPSCEPLDSTQHQDLSRFIQKTLTAAPHTHTNTLEPWLKSFTNMHLSHTVI